MAKVQITDTILRDGHQSQAATRMRTDEMLPACEMLDKVGYYSLECWGGATYDACLRFLNEDPWERLRKLRKALPNTKLQMLLRGQNLLGYRPYADDVVDFFVKKAVENGIDIIRCFDALNDLRNMQTAVKATKKYGGTAEIAMSYTESPVHNEDYFVKLAVDIQKMGADVICIKDMANLLLPYKAYSLVKRLKKETDLPIVLHTHNTTGTGDMVLLKAIEAGVDVVDTCLSPLGSGTSQPATESLVATLKGTEYDTGFAGEPDGQVLRRAGGSAARAQGLRLSAAGHADLPDRGHAGRDERAGRRALQDGAEGIQGLAGGPLRPSAGQGERGRAQEVHRRHEGHHPSLRRRHSAGTRQAA